MPVLQICTRECFAKVLIGLCAEEGFTGLSVLLSRNSLLYLFKLHYAAINILIAALYNNSNFPYVKMQEVNIRA